MHAVCFPDALLQLKHAPVSCEGTHDTGGMLVQVYARHVCARPWVSHVCSWHQPSPRGLQEGVHVAQGDCQTMAASTHADPFHFCCSLKRASTHQNLQASVGLTLISVLLQPILVGTVCQWLVKPILGLLLALTLVPVLGLPHAVGTGVILVRIQSPCFHICNHIGACVLQCLAHARVRKGRFPCVKLPLHTVL